MKTYAWSAARARIRLFLTVCCFLLVLPHVVYPIPPGGLDPQPLGTGLPIWTGFRMEGPVQQFYIADAGPAFNARAGTIFEVENNVALDDWFYTTFDSVGANNTLRSLTNPGYQVNIGTGVGSDCLTCDAAGNMYVGNFMTGTVVKVATDQSTSVFATGLGNPIDMDISPVDGRLYVVDYGGNRILRTDGTTTTVFITGLNDPAGIAFRGNDMFVADGYKAPPTPAAGQLLKYSVSGGDYGTTATVLVASLGRPMRIDVNEFGDIAVPDQESQELRLYDTSGTLVFRYNDSPPSGGSLQLLSATFKRVPDDTLRDISVTLRGSTTTNADFESLHRKFTGLDQVTTNGWTGNLDNRMVKDLTYGGYEKNNHAVDWLMDQAAALGIQAEKVQVDMDGQLNPSTHPVYNVIFTLPGVVYADWDILLYAHMDSTNGADLATTQIAPGAWDSGGGAVQLLTIAKELRNHKFDYTIKFIFHNPEEESHDVDGDGLFTSLASDSMIQYLKASGDNIVAAIGLEGGYNHFGLYEGPFSQEEAHGWYTNQSGTIPDVATVWETLRLATLFYGGRRTVGDTAATITALMSPTGQETFYGDMNAYVLAGIATVHMIDASALEAWNWSLDSEAFFHSSKDRANFQPPGTTAPYMDYRLMSEEAAGAAVAAAQLAVLTTRTSDPPTFDLGSPVFDTSTGTDTFAIIHNTSDQAATVSFSFYPPVGGAAITATNNNPVTVAAKNTTLVNLATNLGVAANQSGSYTLDISGAPIGSITVDGMIARQQPSTNDQMYVPVKRPTSQDVGPIFSTIAANGNDTQLHLFNADANALTIAVDFYQQGSTSVLTTYNVTIPAQRLESFWLGTVGSGSGTFTNGRPTGVDGFFRIRMPNGDFSPSTLLCAGYIENEHTTGQFDHYFIPVEHPSSGAGVVSPLVQVAKQQNQLVGNTFVYLANTGADAVRATFTFSGGSPASFVKDLQPNQWTVVDLSAETFNPGANEYLNRGMSITYGPVPGGPTIVDIRHVMSVAYLFDLVRNDHIHLPVEGPWTGRAGGWYNHRQNVFGDANNDNETFVSLYNTSGQTLWADITFQPWPTGTTANFTQQLSNNGFAILALSTIQQLVGKEVGSFTVRYYTDAALTDEVFNPAVSVHDTSRIDEDPLNENEEYFWFGAQDAYTLAE